MTRTSARILLGRCRDSSDEAAWTELTARFGPRIRAAVVRALHRAGRLARTETVDDVVQETYCRLLARNGRALRACRGRDAASIGAYLGRIAERVALDHLRARTAGKRGCGRVASLDELVEHGREGMLARGPDAERRLLSGELRALFLAACRQVAGRGGRIAFEVMRLAFLDGRTSREISELVGKGVTPKGIDSLLYRARRRLAARGLAIPRRRAVDAAAPG